MQHYKNLLSYCCNGVQLVLIVAMLKQAYFVPYCDDSPSGDLAKARMKKIVCIECLVLLIACISPAIIRWVF
jgi:hypothetical protein